MERSNSSLVFKRILFHNCTSGGRIPFRRLTILNVFRQLQKLKRVTNAIDQPELALANPHNYVRHFMEWFGGPLSGAERISLRDIPKGSVRAAVGILRGCEIEPNDVRCFEAVHAAFEGNFRPSIKRPGQTLEGYITELKKNSDFCTLVRVFLGFGTCLT